MRIRSKPSKARTHARSAMTIAPDQYQSKAEKLIRRLSVYHFGCLAVFSAEREEADTMPRERN